MTKVMEKISKSNSFFMDKNRYLELKHFCLQYSTWKKLYTEIDGIPNRKFSPVKNLKNNSDPVFHAVERREEYLDKIKMVEEAVRIADSELYDYLLKGVTEGISYYGLRLQYDMPACKDRYYRAYRKLFFILDISRK